jgi:hypothetical protein
LIIFAQKVLKHFQKMLTNIFHENVGENVLKKCWI